jgi:hypothetical protein
MRHAHKPNPQNSHSDHAGSFDCDVLSEFIARREKFQIIELLDMKMPQSVKSTFGI